VCLHCVVLLLKGWLLLKWRVTAYQMLEEPFQHVALDNGALSTPTTVFGSSVDTVPCCIAVGDESKLPALAGAPVRRVVSLKDIADEDVGVDSDYGLDDDMMDVRTTAPCASTTSVQRATIALCCQCLCIIVV